MDVREHGWRLAKGSSTQPGVASGLVSRLTRVLILSTFIRALSWSLKSVSPLPPSLPSFFPVCHWPGLVFLHQTDGGFHQIQILCHSREAEHANQASVLAGWPNVPSLFAFSFLFKLWKGAVVPHFLTPGPKVHFYLSSHLCPRGAFCIMQNSLFCTLELAAVRLEPD